MMTTIDFATVAENADLPAIMSRLGIEIRHGKALCPFHDNTMSPAMTVFEIGGRWRFDCKSCGVKGDAVGFVAKYDRITNLEAARKLAGVEAPEKGPGVRQVRPNGSQTTPRTSDAPSPRHEPPRPSEDRPGAWADPAWQEAVDPLVRQAQEVLWSPRGRDAHEWLRRRGLDDLTIRRFGLGFVPDRVESTPVPGFQDTRGKPRKVWAPRGITLPWPHPEGWFHAGEPTPGPRWVGVNVRRLADDVNAPLPDGVEKCHAFPGSQRGFCYPSGDLAPGVPTLICEGEWDVLVATQELGCMVNVVGVGGAKQAPKMSALESLDASPEWFLALHNDPAGNEGAKLWWSRSRGKATRLILPPGIDLNDMHRRGDGLASWFHSEMELLG